MNKDRLKAELELCATKDRRKQRSFRSDDGWHSRGYLPHYDRHTVTQFITFRLYDSLPQYKLRQLEESSLEKTKRIEDLIDSGLGECYLRQPPIAELVEQFIQHFNNNRYLLHAGVLMPNHVHLLTVLPGFTLTLIMRSLKSYTANRANKILGRTGEFWFPEYYDRYIRTARHYDAVVSYIRNNPINAGLSDRPDEWRFLVARSWSSASCE